MTQVSALTIQNEDLAITRTTLPLDQATTIADSIDAGTETEAQYVAGLLSQVADTTIPAVAVEASMYNAVGSSAEITTLATQFLPSQLARQNGLNAQVYACEALGLAFAFADENGGHGFVNTFGPSNALTPATPTGDAVFAAEAAAAIFGAAETGSTVNAILGWVTNWEAFYTAHGIPGVANATTGQIDLAARGAAWGDAVGVALVNDLGPLPGQVINFLDDAAQGTAIYSAPLASDPTAALFAGNGQNIFPNKTWPSKFPNNNFPSNGPIDSADWHPHTGITSFLVKTQMRPTLPNASDGAMQLNFDTYNPSGGPAFNTFFGSEAISGTTQDNPLVFNPNAIVDGTAVGPLAFVATVRYDPSTFHKGIIGGFMFLYSDNGDGNSHDEIDFEGMSNTPNQIQTNIYHNQPPGNGDPISYSSSAVGMPANFSTTTYHTYEIDWFKDMVEWKVDGQVVRTGTVPTSEDPHFPGVPTQDMALHFNIWTGEPGWPTSDPSTTPASSQADDQTTTIDVKSVQVAKIASHLETAADDAPAANNPLNTVQNEYLYGTGNDQIFAGGGNNTIDGGPGTNVAVFSGAAGNFEISATAGETTLAVTDKSGAQGTDTVLNCQTLQFNDRTVDASSVVQAANLDAQTFVPIIDLYAAYLHRAPDALGLYHWADALSNGTSLTDIAHSFSAEAAASQPPGQSLSEIVSTAYTDILHRAPAAGELNNWVQQLQSGLSLQDFPLSFIMAAKASGGADAQAVAAEETIGGQYAIEQGLNDVAHATTVFAALGPTGAQAASSLIDSYATAAALPTSSELVVKLVGVHIGEFVPLA